MHAAALAYATLSVRTFIDKIGDYVAFGAIIGVALLVIMVFVQARETSLLRERAEDAEEDLERLRVYAEQVGRQAAQAQQTAQTAQTGQTAAPRARPAQPPAAAAGMRAPSTAAVATPAAAGAGGGTAFRVAGAPPTRGGGMPFAPVGVGAPALHSATRLIPLPEAAPAPSTPAANGRAAAAAPAGTAPGTTPAPAMTSAPPATSTTAAGASAPPAAVVPPPSLTTTPPPAAGPRPSSGRAPRRDYGRADESESRVGRGAIALGAILVAVIVVAAVLIITHHSSSSGSVRAASRSTHGATTKSGTKSKNGTVVVDPTHVRVAVLNGTTTDNLAADVSAKLNKRGFQQGETGNYDDQAETGTTVGYLPRDRSLGEAVAKALGVSRGDVHPVNSAAQQIVCPNGASACADQVVVTVGANLNSDAS